MWKCSRELVAANKFAAEMFQPEVCAKVSQQQIYALNWKREIVLSNEKIFFNLELGWETAGQLS